MHKHWSILLTEGETHDRKAYEAIFVCFLLFLMNGDSILMVLIFRKYCHMWISIVEKVVKSASNYFSINIVRREIFNASLQISVGTTFK